ncbi:VWA domain-containing protein [Devosia sp. 2618]|uniref:vWA domain-containing protein n=1 Tax=Devosia sp. 2618 TaxID=3156454 RepID=UPI003397AF32
MSNDMPNDPFNALKGGAPDPRAEAKKRAMLAGMAAFEACQKKVETAPKGNIWGQRLSSIITSLKGKSIMDMRIPIGTVAIALVVLPLGYQLYSSTSMTPAQSVAERQELAEPVVAPAPIAPAPIAPAPIAIEAPEAAAKETIAVAPPPPPRPATTPAPAPEPIPQAEVNNLAGQAADEAQVAAEPAQQAPMADMATPPQVLRPAPMAAPSVMNRVAPQGVMLPETMAIQRPQPDGDQFTSFDEQRLKVVASDPVSTFSLDVDTASYSYARRLLEEGYLPAPDSVRIEELINYFPYDYPAAQSAEVPFQPTMAVYPTPWNPKTQLLQIGIKGYVPVAGEDKPSNLVFLIDTSGSMDAPDKLPLLKRAFSLLVDQLSGNDTVSIVAYAGSAGVVLEPTVATKKAEILAALDQLSAGGSTAGSEGIELAYKLAEQAKVVGGTNRVILATDGDFNVGIDDPAKLKDFIKAKRDSGVTLSVLGFGQGNLDDATMQALAQNGNGNASYISSFREAQKVLVEEMGGTLHMIAKDVKIQVEFNPALVSEYRLIGYEARALNREDFNNDKVDAGDVGAGTTVTAIYEITPAGSGAELVDPLRYGQTANEPTAAGDEIAFLRMRYKLPDSDVSQLIEQAVTPSVVYDNISEVSDDMRFAAAVAAFGQKIKDSNYGGSMTWAEIEALARSGRGADENGYRSEFIQLVKAAASLKPDTASAN